MEGWDEPLEMPALLRAGLYYCAHLPDGSTFRFTYDGLLNVDDTFLHDGNWRVAEFRADVETVEGEERPLYHLTVEPANDE
jgi:hypothetical protein